MAGFVDEVKEKTTMLYERVTTYFSGLELFSLIAWGLIGLGLILIIIALVLW